jgi:hypothetical protein
MLIVILTRLHCKVSQKAVSCVPNLQSPTTDPSKVSTSNSVFSLLASGGENESNSRFSAQPLYTKNMRHGDDVSLSGKKNISQICLHYSTYRWCCEV